MAWKPLPAPERPPAMLAGTRERDRIMKTHRATKPAGRTSAQKGAGRAARRSAPRMSRSSFGAVSRILCSAPGGAPDLHFSQLSASGDLPCNAPGGAAQDAAYPRLSDGPPSRLCCLAPDWVFRAAGIAARRGGLLPHLFTLTPRLPPRRFVFCDTVHPGALTRRARAFTRNPARWCPDFPLRGSKNSERRSGSETRAASRRCDRTGRK